MLQRILWLLLAAIHIPPALAFFRPALLRQLYGVEPGSGSALLLQHRAALFLMVVAICVSAALDPTSRRIAVVAAGLSMGSFLLLFVSAGLPAALRSIAIADMVGLLLLAFLATNAFGRA